MPRLTPVFAATTLMAGVIAVYLWHQLRGEREQLAHLQQQLAELGQWPAPLLPATGSAFESPSGAGSAAIPAAGAAPAVPAPGMPTPAQARDMRGNPGWCEDQRASGPLWISRFHPDVQTALNLSQAETTALFDLLVQQQEKALLASCGSDAEQQQARLSAATRLQDQQMEIQNLLVAKYQQWEEYLPTREGRTRVHELRNIFASTPTPLTDAQVAPLLALVLDEGKRRRDENGARPPPGPDAQSQLEYEKETLKLLEQSYGRVLSSAESFLHADQLAVMRNTMQRAITMQRERLQGAE